MGATGPFLHAGTPGLNQAHQTMRHRYNRKFHSSLALRLALGVGGAALWAWPGAALSQPEQLRIGLVVSDLVEPRALPAHLRSAYPQLLDSLDQDLRLLFGSLGRVQVGEWQLDRTGGRESYRGAEPVDFVVHVIIHKFYKIFRNQALPYAAGVGMDRQTDSPYEIVAQPAIIGRLEVELVESRRNRVVWSGLRDTTVRVPCASYNFIYNPEKYPGWTPPDLLQTHLAEVMRLDLANNTVHRALQVADRWFVSYPNDDLRAARRVLPGLAAAFYADLDGNLPLEGRIASLLPVDAGQPQLLLNIGAQHGLTPQARLTVWRPSPSAQQVGQVEVVRVDSTTAVARLSRLEKPLRQRGEGPLPGDRVISRNRSSLRRGPL